MEFRLSKLEAARLRAEREAREVERREAAIKRAEEAVERHGDNADFIDELVAAFRARRST